ncbi:MAG: putative U5 small nuclear ribonucleoprotein 200 kDa helicase, partial [Streblomastix strix]
SLALAGIALLYEGQNPYVERVLRLLYRKGYLHLLIVSHSQTWKLDREKSKGAVIIAGPTTFDTTSRRHVDLPLSDMLNEVGKGGIGRRESEYKKKEEEEDDDDNRIQKEQMIKDQETKTPKLQQAKQQQHPKIPIYIMCQQNKIQMYDRFIRQPLPIESQLTQTLDDFLNAQIVCGSVQTMEDAINDLTWTYMYHRLAKNPNYYGLPGATRDFISDFLSELVEERIDSLNDAKMAQLERDDDEDVPSSISPLNLGLVSAYYGVSCSTMQIMSQSLHAAARTEVILACICAAAEFDYVPVRPGEPTLLFKIAKRLPYAVKSAHYDDAHLKVNVLLQTHFAQSTPVPSDQIIRSLQSQQSQSHSQSNILPILFNLLTDAMQDEIQMTIIQIAQRLVHACVDVLASCGWLSAAMKAMLLSQMIVQGLNAEDRGVQLLQLPHVTSSIISKLRLLDMTHKQNKKLKKNQEKEKKKKEKENKKKSKSKKNQQEEEDQDEEEDEQEDEREIEDRELDMDWFIELEEEVRQEGLSSLSKEQITEIASVCNRYIEMDVDVKLKGAEEK